MTALSRPLTIAQLRVGPLAAWGLAVGLALAGQLMFTPLGALGAGRILFGLSIVVAVIGVVRLDLASFMPARPLAIVPPRSIDLKRPRVREGLVLMAIGGLGTLATIPMLASAPASILGAWLWGIALLLVLGGAWILGGGPTGLRHALDRAGRVELALVVGLLVLAAVLRFPSIETIPPEVHGDEALTGLGVRLSLSGELAKQYGALSGLSIVIHGLPALVLGDNLWSLRIGSAIEGTLCVLLLYLLVRRWFGVRTALLAGAFLAVAQWHIHFSRDGISYMQAVLVTLLLFYLLARALDTQAWTDWVLVGCTGMFCLLVYYAARLAPVLVGLWLLYRVVRGPGFWHSYWRGMVAALLGALLFTAAIVPILLTHPELVNARTGAVWLLTPENVQHAENAYRVNNLLSVLWIQTTRTLEAFNLSGETSQQYFRRDAPLLDFWTAALLVPGAALVTARAVTQPSYAFVAAWLWLSLVLGSVLTVDAPFSPRLVAVIPALALLPAIALETGWRGIEARGGIRVTQVAATSVGLILVLALVTNVQNYFSVHVVQYQPAGFNTVLARLILATNDRYRFYLMVSGASLGYDTIRFLAPTVDGVDANDPSFPLPVQDATPGKGAAFILRPGDLQTETKLAQLRALYPGGREERYQSAKGEPLFINYFVEAEALTRPTAAG